MFVETVGKKTNIQLTNRNNYSEKAHNETTWLHIWNSETIKIRVDPNPVHIYP